MAAHHHLQLQLQVIQRPLVTSLGISGTDPQMGVFCRLWIWLWGWLRVFGLYLLESLFPAVLKHCMLKAFRLVL